MGIEVRLSRYDEWVREPLTDEDTKSIPVATWSHRIRSRGTCSTTVCQDLRLDGLGQGAFSDTSKTKRPLQDGKKDALVVNMVS